jgi:hypothetical protein
MGHKKKPAAKSNAAKKGDGGTKSRFVARKDGGGKLIISVDKSPRKVEGTGVRRLGQGGPKPSPQPPHKQIKRKGKGG